MAASRPTIIDGASPFTLIRTGFTFEGRVVRRTGLDGDRRRGRLAYPLGQMFGPMKTPKEWPSVLPTGT